MTSFAKCVYDALQKTAKYFKYTFHIEYFQKYAHFMPFVFEAKFLSYQNDHSTLHNFYIIVYLLYYSYLLLIMVTLIT